MSYKIRFLNHKHAVSLPAFVDWQVTFLSWKLPGGAEKAVLVGQASGLDYSQLDSFLEIGIDSPVEVYSATGEVVWQGWVEKIAFYQGFLKTTCSLESMFNRLLVRYPKSGLESSPFDRWAYTSWQEDQASVTRFGAKEKLLTIQQADACLAEQALQQGFEGLNSLPSFNMNAHAQTVIPYFELTARGWWQRLSWVLDQEEGGKIAHLGGGKSRFELGRTIAYSRLAQSFQLDQSNFKLSHIWLRVSVTGQPEDKLQVAICNDDNGNPGSILGQADSPANSLDGGWAWVHWELPEALELNPQTKYWMIVKRSAAMDASSYYEIESDDGYGYAGGQLKRWDGGAWLPLSQDLRFGLIAQEDAMQLIKDMIAKPPFATLPSFSSPTPIFSGFVNWQNRILPVYRWRSPEKNCLERIEDWLKGDPQISALVDAQRNLKIISIPGETKNGMNLSTNHALYPLSQIDDMNATTLLGCPLIFDHPQSRNKSFVQSISWRMGKGYSWYLSALKP